MNIMRIIPVVISVLLVAMVFVGDVEARDRMTRAEWQEQMTELTAKRDALQARMGELDGQIGSLNEQVAQKQASLDACRNEILTLLGTTDEEIQSLIGKIRELEDRVARLERLREQDLLARLGDVEDINKTIQGMKKDPRHLHPDVYGRLMDLEGRVKALMDRLDKMVQVYTVGTWSRDRDCLWNIAKRSNIYNNAWLWPRIWQANRDKIRDPDIIHPGQRLQIPPKGDGRMTSEERRAAEGYYRNKREGQR